MSPPLRILQVTSRASRPLDDDLSALHEALVGRGIAAGIQAWDEEMAGATWDLAVIRSPWDYPLHREAFLAWAEGLDRLTPVANPPALLRWNTDKRYLKELAEKGLPVVPTSWTLPGDPLPSSFPLEWVVKPSVSAGAMDTMRYRQGEEEASLSHISRLLRERRGVMVQPYQGKVDTQGETALVYMAGRYSHAVRKRAILTESYRLQGGVHAVEEILPTQPTGAEFDVGEAVLKAIPPSLGTWLYARVDLVPGEDRKPLLLELELTEPSLFLQHGDGAVERMAAAVERRARSDSRLGDREIPG